MTSLKLDCGVIFILQILMGWTFLYAGSWQLLQKLRHRWVPQSRRDLPHFSHILLRAVCRIPTLLLSGPSADRLS